MRINTVFLGDIVPGGLLARDLSKKTIDKQISAILSSADIVIGNLESSFGRADWQVGGKAIIYSRPEDAVRLSELKLSVVSLANNHTFDLGIRGFQKTIEILDQMGIKYCGAGQNATEARKPVFVEKKGLKMGFLAYSRDEQGIMIAGENEPGVALLDERNMLEDIAAAKKQCEHLFVLLHWDREYTWLPDPSSRALMKKLIKAGVAGVIGGHSHRLQAFGKYRGKPYFYSLGNFLFPDYLLGPPRTLYYPERFEDVDIKSLPIKSTIGPVDEVHHRIWRKYSRFGIIGQVQIEKDKLESRVVFSQSARKDSRLSLLEGKADKKMRLWLKTLNLLIQSPCYPIVFKAYKGFARLYVLFKKIIHGFGFSKR